MVDFVKQQLGEATVVILLTKFTEGGVCTPIHTPGFEPLARVALKLTEKYTLGIFFWSAWPIGLFHCAPIQIAKIKTARTKA